MKRIAPIASLVAATLLLGATSRTGPGSPVGLTVHEWGTFTSIAGRDGLAIQWLPLNGPGDLPCFVSHMVNDTYKGGLWGTVRMETPVLYFYSPRELTLSARVQFRSGEITEWYPRAEVGRGTFSFASTGSPVVPGTIEWRDVKVLPGTAEAYPVEKAPSHYYAARHTDAAPVEAQGQKEKFLFYRGVGRFELPISATASDDGAIQVRNLSGDTISGGVLFENRDGKIGYRVQSAVGAGATFAPPELNGDVASLERELEHLLIAQGLYAKEAAAMVETWRDSWLEQGTRVLYLVPRRVVDAVLPLQVSPAPANTARVFVGRMEVITPATEKEVKDALAANDRATLTKYGRFLQPISDRILSAMPMGPNRTRTAALVQSVASARFDAAARCPAR